MPKFELLSTIATGRVHLPNYRVQAHIPGEGAVAFIPFSSPPLLQAIRLSDGAALWSFSDLSAEPVYMACAAADWRQDGTINLMVLHGQRMLLLDGQTGDLRNEKKLSIAGMPSHAAIAFIPSLSSGPIAIILVQQGGLVAVNGALEELWHVPSNGNSVGHVVFIGDTDGDGEDECLFSIEKQAELLHVDHDGSVIWRKGILDELRLDPEGNEDHVDQLAIYDINGDGHSEILIATGGCCLSSDGEVLWNHNSLLTHGQCVVCGTFENAEEPLAVFADAWTPTPQIVASNGKGELQWVYRDFTHRIFTVARLDRAKGYILVAEQDYQEGDPLYHVHLLDGTGHCLDKFSFADEGGVQMPHNPQAGHPPSNLLWRGVHVLLCQDVNDDGEEEVVIDDLAGVLRILNINDTGRSLPQS